MLAFYLVLELIFCSLSDMYGIKKTTSNTEVVFVSF